MIAIDSILPLCLTVAFIAFFIFLISKLTFFRSSNIPVGLIQVGFLIKLIAATALWLIYSQHYTERTEADTFRYFDDSKVVYESLRESPMDYLKMVSGIRANEPQLKKYYDKMDYWYDAYSPINDNRAIIRLQAVIRLISFGSYHVHMAIICFLSLIGSIAAAKAFGKFHKSFETTIFTLFIIIPSTCFWGSGLMKDSLAVFAIGLTIYQLSHFKDKFPDGWQKPTSLLLALGILIFVRFQFALLLTPFVLGYLISLCVGKSSTWSYFIITSATVLTGVLVWNLCLDKPLQDSLQTKREAFINLAEAEQAHSIFNRDPLKTELPGILIEPLKGLYFSMTQPIELNKQPLIMISSIENALLLILIFYLVYRAVRLKTRIKSNFLLFSLLFSISYLMIAGMTTPVAGALVRYKSIVIPFLIGPMLIMSGFKISTNHWSRFTQKP